MERKNYRYTNNLGRKKEIWITLNPNEQGEYPFSIWDLATGELCSSGEASKEDLVSFLARYNVKADF